jgi:hypothetical protein
MYEIKLADGVLGMNVHGKFHELHFTSPVDAFLTHPSWEVAPLHLQAENELRPKFLRCPHGPSFADLDYNDGAADVGGHSCTAADSGWSSSQHLQKRHECRV